MEGLDCANPSAVVLPPANAILAGGIRTPPPLTLRPSPPGMMTVTNVTEMTGRIGTATESVKSATAPATTGATTVVVMTGATIDDETTDGAIVTARETTATAVTIVVVTTGVAGVTEMTEMTGMIDTMGTVGVAIDTMIVHAPGDVMMKTIDGGGATTHLASTSAGVLSLEWGLLMHILVLVSCCLCLPARIVRWLYRLAGCMPAAAWSKD